MIQWLGRTINVPGLDVCRPGTDRRRRGLARQKIDARRPSSTRGHGRSDTANWPERLELFPGAIAQSLDETSRCIPISPYS